MMFGFRNAIRHIASRLRYVVSGKEWHILRSYDTSDSFCGRLASRGRQVYPELPSTAPLCAQCHRLCIGDPENRRNKPPPAGRLCRTVPLFRLAAPKVVKPLTGQLTFGGGMFDEHGDLVDRK